LFTELTVILEEGNESAREMKAVYKLLIYVVQRMAQEPASLFYRVVSGEVHPYGRGW